LSESANARDGFQQTLLLPKQAQYAERDFDGKLILREEDPDLQKPFCVRLKSRRESDEPSPLLSLLLMIAILVQERRKVAHRFCPEWHRGQIRRSQQTDPTARDECIENERT
jgi:hypothetical protein